MDFRSLIESCRYAYLAICSESDEGDFNFTLSKFQRTHSSVSIGADSPKDFRD